MKKFPLKIYVVIENEQVGENEYLSILENGIEGVEHNGQRVAEYVLNSEWRAQITRQLTQPERNKR